MKALRRLCKGLLVVFFLVMLFNLTAVTTLPSEYILVKQFGEVVRVIDKPGLSFKIPFIQNTQSIPKYKMLYDVTPSDINTKDKKVMLVDCFAIWHITDPLQYLSSLGASVANAEGRINTTVYNSLKTVLSATTQEEVISGRDGELATAITENIGNQLDKYGIEIYKVETKMLDLPDANKDSVYARMISERANIAAGYKSQGDSQSEMIRNGTDREVSITKSTAQAEAEKIKAEGEAQYMEILSNAYNNADKADFYNFVRSLDALKATLKGENKTIILNENSELAHILMGIR